MKLDKGSILSAITVIGTALAMLAMHGKGAVEALAAVPTMLNAWAAQLPLGVTSFGLSVALSMLVWLSLHRAKFTGQHYSPDTVALCVATLAMIGQQWAAGITKPGAVLTALILGLIAGLLVPYLCRLIVGKPAA
jgi:hypothetical protein